MQPTNSKRKANDVVIPAKAGIQPTNDRAPPDDARRALAVRLVRTSAPSVAAACLDPRLRGDDESRMLVRLVGWVSAATALNTYCLRHSARNPTPTRGRWVTRGIGAIADNEVTGRAKPTYALVGLLLLTLSATPALAVNPEEILANPALESRARNLSQGLRCLVCQNQSIDDSDAGLAKDLRVLLRERLTAGDTDEQAVAYIVNRYGNFVLLKPPFQWNTALLWLTPVLLLLLTGGGFYSTLRRGAQSAEPAALNPEDEARLAHLLDDGPNR